MSLDKPLRRLSNFDFSGKDAHVALVDKAANGHTILCLKSTKGVKIMAEESKVDVQALIAKSVAEQVEKLQKAHQAELDSIQKQLITYKKAEEDAALKAVQDQIKKFTCIGLVADDHGLMFKSFKEKDKSGYDALIKALTTVVERIEKMGVFKEEGVNGGANEDNSKSGLSKEILAKVAKLMESDKTLTRPQAVAKALRS